MERDAWLFVAADRELPVGSCDNWAGGCGGTNGCSGRSVAKLSGSIAGFTLFAGAAALLTPQARRRLGVPYWLLLAASIGAAITVNELVGKPVPFLRWSFLTMMLRGRHLLREWQVGDGRETALEKYVVASARPGDVEEAIRVIDHFCRHVSYLINVGDEKGKILDNAVERTQPRRLLELGTYCGYSALRMARAMPREARLYSLEFNTANAVIARRILAHAGVDDRVTVLVGTLGDGGETIRALKRECNFTPGSLDLVFLDHDKKAYLSDLELILAERWLHPGSVVVADNILVPGAPAYRAHMRDNDGTLWHTTEHRT
ncbi:MAG TPA: O-methyltransferase, partial [Jatrophihabitantaceae bacterium]|nr:O-methyltransferase [Jatrophihabitantaceae bacterium]